MACGCAANRRKNEGSVLQLSTEIKLQVHQILPGQSCVFCGEKHASCAYALLMGGGDCSSALGELELSRRHLVSEYQDAAVLVASAEYTLASGDRNTACRQLSDALGKLADVAMNTDPDTSSEADALAPSYINETAAAVTNPFVGWIHVCAAYRLAFEVGYMVPNRSMIIGDLALAREHLTRFDIGIGDYLRELRHRVQTIRAADLNIYWPYVCDKVLEALKKVEDKGEYLPELRKWLGVGEEDRDFPPGV